jgi:hypothetical protein
MAVEAIAFALKLGVRGLQDNSDSLHRRFRGLFRNAALIIRERESYLPKQPAIQAVPVKRMLIRNITSFDLMHRNEINRCRY